MDQQSSISLSALVTPTKRSHNLITSTPFPAKRTRLSLNKAFSGIDTISVNALESVEESSAISPSNIPEKVGIPTKEKESESFKPKFKKGLYGQLFQGHEKVEIIATNFVTKCELNKLEAITSILQLIVDVAGFQSFKVSNYLKQYQEDFKQTFLNVVDQLINGNSNANEGIMCILGSRSKVAKDFTKVLFTFLKCLVNQCNTVGCLYEIFKNVVMFCGLLARSTRKVCIVTSVMVATKLCSEFIHLRNIIEEKTSLFSCSDDQDVIDTLSNFIIVLSVLHTKYSCMPDRTLTNAQELTAEEIKTWIKLRPAEFLTDTTFLILQKLCCNENVTVRRKSLKTCLHISKNNTYVKHTKTHIYILVRAIKNRIEDVDSEVQAMAIRFFSNCIERYPPPLTNSNDIIHLFENRLYSKHFNVAQESAIYFLTLFKSLEINELRGILKLHNSSSKPEIENGVAILVESFFEQSDALTDLPQLVLIIKSTNFNINDKNVLTEILYYVVHLHLFGKSISNRPNVNIAMDFSKSCRLVIDSILSNLHQMLFACVDSDTSLIWTFKTTLMINYAEMSYNRYRVYVAKAVDYIFEEIIENNKNPEVLSLAFALIKKLSEDGSPFKIKTDVEFEKYSQRIISCYKQNIELCLEENIGAQDMAMITEQVHLVSMMSEVFSLNDHLEWREIYFEPFSPLLETYPEITAHQITAGTWYIIWEFRGLLEDGDNDRAKSFIVKVIKYMNGLLSLLENSFIDNYLGITICECICNLCIHFQQLKNDNLSSGIFELSNVNIGKIDKADILVKFITNTCFKNIFANSLTVRRRLLWKFIQLLFSDYFITVKFFGNIWHILKHYISFSEEYKKIFYALIKKLKQAGLVPFVSVLFHTLTEVHLSKKKPSEVKDLLQEFSYLIPVQFYKSVINMVLATIIRDERQIPFLEYLAPFTAKLNQRERLSILSVVKTDLPKNYIQHDSVVKFLGNLKESKKTKSVVSRRYGTVSCRSSTSSAMTLNDTELDETDDTSVYIEDSSE